MTEVQDLKLAEMEAEVESIRQSPKEAGILHLMVCRPGNGSREVLEEGQPDPTNGLLGDNWKAHVAAPRRTAWPTWKCNSTS